MPSTYLSKVRISPILLSAVCEITTELMLVEANEWEWLMRAVVNCSADRRASVVDVVHAREGNIRQRLARVGVVNVAST
ncbi:hypothetical protein ACLOJK_001224 [Asimina triloba]